MRTIHYVLVPGHIRRILAFGLDEIQRFLFLTPLLFLGSLGEFLGLDETYALVVGGLSIYLFWMYRTFCLYFAGATPGKWLMGLEVQSRDGEELSFIQSGLRILADDLGLFLLGIPRLLLFFRLDRTQFSDWVAETRVVPRRGGVLPLQRSSGLGLTLILISLFFLQVS